MTHHLGGRHTYGLLILSKAVKPSRERTVRVVKNRSAILVALANAFFAAPSVVFTSYMIPFLMTRGMDATQAADVYEPTIFIFK